MKKNFFLLMLAASLSAVTMSMMACGQTSKGQGETDADSTLQAEAAEVEEVEEAQPIGDRALFMVHGNVKTITFVKNCDEFKSSYEPFDGADYSAQVRQKVKEFIRLTTISNQVTFDETGKTIEVNSEFFTSEKNNDGETVYLSIFYGSDPVYMDNDLMWKYGREFIYDAKGRRIYTGGIDCGVSYEYDQHNRLVKSEGGGEGGFSYDVQYTYDKDGNVVKEETIESCEFDETLTTTSIVTYTILEKDDKGNWTKRKSSAGQIDERTIEYY